MASRILIIDDDPEFVEGLKGVLETEGFEIVTASDGETGFTRALEDRPDLIILDVMMRTITEGMRVAQQLHHDERTCKTPVLMLSSIKETLRLAEDLKPDEACLPVAEFLEKPIAPDELVTRIRRALEKKGSV